MNCTIAPDSPVPSPQFELSTLDLHGQPAADDSDKFRAEPWYPNQGVVYGKLDHRGRVTQSHQANFGVGGGWPQMPTTSYEDATAGDAAAKVWADYMDGKQVNLSLSPLAPPVRTGLDGEERRPSGSSRRFSS